MEYCGAKRRQGGEPCRKPAGWGTPNKSGRCSLHLGNTPSHRRAADMEAARQAASKLDLSLTISPVEALLDELNTRYRWKMFYEALIMELPTHPAADELVPPSVSEDGELTQGYWIRGEPGLYGRVYHVSGQPTGEAKPHVLVELYERERQQLAKVASECVKANVSQRHIDLQEGLARTLAAAITFTIVGLGHDPSSEEAMRIGAEALVRAGRRSAIEGTATDA